MLLYENNLLSQNIIASEGGETGNEFFVSKYVPERDSETGMYKTGNKIVVAGFIKQNLVIVMDWKAKGTFLNQDLNETIKYVRGLLENL